MPQPENPRETSSCAGWEAYCAAARALFCQLGADETVTDSHPQETDDVLSR